MAVKNDLMPRPDMKCVLAVDWNWSCDTKWAKRVKAAGDVLVVGATMKVAHKRTNALITKMLIGQ